MSAAETMPDSSVRLGAQSVTRRFGPVIANDGITFRARRGEVHAIVGGNGAGKSTLMRILQGMDRPDEGMVVVDGSPTVFLGPADAFARGIGMVHQEFMLVPGLTLLENLVLADEPVDRLGRVDVAKALAAARKLERQAGVTLAWDTLVEDAPVHVRQVVEILRLLYRGADVLILDEPTAVLAPAQVGELLALLRRLRGEGRTILFISHKLDEVLDVADQITVIRNGRVVGSLAAAEASKPKLAEMMIGEVVARPQARPRSLGDSILEIERLSARNSRGHLAIAGFDLAVRAGEIVGIAGVAGNGQDELAGAITGLGPMETGAIRIGGAEVSHLTLARRREIGLAYLSPDRAAEGLSLAAAISDNVVAGHHRRPGLSAGGVLRKKAIARHVEELLDRYSVRRSSAQAPAASLSGGNQQRIVVARELDGAPSLLLACQPTRGVDIRGIAFIHQCLLDFSTRGGAVLLISEELEELVALSDRIAVIYGGEKIGELARGSADIEGIGRMMLGSAA